MAAGLAGCSDARQCAGAEGERAPSPSCSPAKAGTQGFSADSLVTLGRIDIQDWKAAIACTFTVTPALCRGPRPSLHWTWTSNPVLAARWPPAQGRGDEVFARSPSERECRYALGPGFRRGTAL